MPGMGWHYGPCKKAGGSVGGIALLIVVIFVATHARSIENFISETLLIAGISLAVLVPLVWYLAIRAVKNSNRAMVCQCDKCCPIEKKRTITAYVTSYDTRRSVSDTIVRPAIQGTIHGHRSIDGQYVAKPMDRKN